MDLNAREQLLAAADWYGIQNEDLSFGLKSADDALKLWRFWCSSDASKQGLAEFCDAPESAEEWRNTLVLFDKVLGYNPFENAFI